MIATNTTMLENAYYISQIISSVVVVVSLVIAFVNFFQHKKESNISKSRDRIQKALDLMEYYKDNILDKLGIIMNIYNQCGIIKILESIESKKMQNFDIVEINEVFTKSNLAEIRNITQSKEFLDILIDLEINHSLFEVKKDIKRIESNTDTEDRSQKETITRVEINPTDLKHRYSYTVNLLLNNLEYFAMSFKYELADSDVVYQSLHQTYIKGIQALYYDISINNQPGKDQYFTGIVYLYNKWVAENEDQKEKEIAATRSIAKKVKPLFTEKQKRAL